MPRVAFSMTIDPDGAMHDWVDVPDGWSLLKIPTQEIVHLVGPGLYRQLLIDLCERERPELLVTHPPYDWLDPTTADRLRAAGTRLCAYAFDDEIFAADYGAKVREEIARIYDRYVTTREVRWATGPLAALPERPAEHEVVLVGRAYPRRQELVAQLRAAGIAVETRGLGWPEGFVSRAEMLELYSRAAVVLTTADWESREIPMVKHRLLDAAMLGAFQIAQAAPDLRGYFSDQEVPSFAGAAELVARVKEALVDPDRRRRMAAAARRRALDEHTWSRRLPELVAGLVAEPVGERVAGLPLADQEPSERSHFFDGMLVALASRAESDGRIPAAAALWQEAAVRQPDDPSVAAGLGRCLRDLGRREEALEWLAHAATASPSSTCADAIDARLPSFGVGTGLGRLGLLPTAAEPMVWQVATLIELERFDEAARLLDKLDGKLAHAVAAQLTLGDRPALQPVRAALERLRRR